jgi:sarcosine oxidase subunit alpha
VPGACPQASRSAGAAKGTFTLGGCLAEGLAAGAAAAHAAGWGEGTPPAAPLAAGHRPAPLAPLWQVRSRARDKCFVDFQNDVTTADIALAAREGYTSVEHLKRYTTLGMGTDQGRTSNIIGLGVVAQATGKSVPEIGTTTFRPPYTPMSFGAIAGTQRNNLFLPVRRTAVFDWHVAHHAEFEPVGHWRRPYCYPRGGEDRQAAIHREILAVRNHVGLLDASTLGKIEIKGPDAAEFLDRVYTNMFSTLKPGRCRYGLMMKDMPNLIRFCPEGLVPFVGGFPVVASGA